MIKFSFILLLFTIPFLGGQPLWGVPLWAWGSLAMTLVYGLILIITIEKRWDTLKEPDNE